MLDLYFWTTPNGYKVTTLLEELGWQYNVVEVNIGKGGPVQTGLSEEKAPTTESRH